MKTSYGLPYQGSKNRLAERILDVLPASSTFVDLFAGGGAMTHAALLSEKYEEVYANDISKTILSFLAAAQGEYDGWQFFPTRSEFQDAREVDDFISILFSFSNNRTTYLYGKEHEDFDLICAKLVASNSIAERKLHLRRLLKYIASLPQEQLEKQLSPKRVDSLRTEMLNRIERVKKIATLSRTRARDGRPLVKHLHVTTLDYRDVLIPDGGGVVVYADPPYKNTSVRGYVKQKFNYDNFERWLAHTEFPVYVSEYTCPKDCEVVATFTTQNNAGLPEAHRRVHELLCLHKRWV